MVLAGISRYCGSFMWIVQAAKRRRSILCLALLRTAHRRDRLKPYKVGSQRSAIDMDRRLLIVTLALTTGWFAVDPLAAARAAEPVEVAKLPFLEIFSPTFFWSDELDVVR